MSEKYNIEEIVERLIGPVIPCGSHGNDVRNLENLKALCNLSESITDKICLVANTNHAGRASMKTMANYAAKRLEDNAEGINDCLENIKE